MTRPLFLALCLLATPAHADTLVGYPRVVDGDTLAFHDRVVRLWGIDAPEYDQLCGDWACGIDAAKALEGVADRQVTCTGKRHDKYGRLVALCVTDSGEDIAAWLVQHGWAVDWPEYSGGAYARQQAIAEANDRGIWAGSFVLEKSGIGGE
jgi:endonuclease YncB( thermonuclease family)